MAVVRDLPPPYKVYGKWATLTLYKLLLVLRLGGKSGQANTGLDKPRETKGSIGHAFSQFTPTPYHVSALNGFAL